MAEKPIIEVQGLTKRFKGLTAVHLSLIHI